MWHCWINSGAQKDNWQAKDQPQLLPVGSIQLIILPGLTNECLVLHSVSLWRRVGEGEKKHWSVEQRKQKQENACATGQQNNEQRRSDISKSHSHFIKIAVITGWTGFALDERQGCEVIRPIMWGNALLLLKRNSEQKGRFFRVLLSHN